MANADTTILSATLVTVGATTAASVLPHRVNRSPAGIECVKGEFPDFKMLMGQALTFTGLGIIAPAAPKLASMFAVLIGATAFTYYALPIIQEVFGGEGICTAGEKAVVDDSSGTTPRNGTSPTRGRFTEPTLPNGKVLP